MEVTLSPLVGPAHDSLERGKDVEGALGIEAAHPVYAVETVDKEVPPLLELPDHHVDRVLRARERGEGGLLRDRSRVGGALALNIAHSLDDLFFPGRETYPPPRHRIGLGYRVGDDRHLLDRSAEGGDARMLVPVVDDLVIDLVGDEMYAVLHGQLPYLLQVRQIVDRAAGVGRVVEDDPLRLARDLLLQHLRSELVILLLVSLDEDGGSPGKLCHSGI